MAQIGCPPLIACVQNENPSKIAFSWLLLLRWGAVASQALLIFFIHYVLAINIPVFLVSLIIGFEVFSNFIFCLLNKRQQSMPQWLFGLAILLDITLLTALIVYTGGPLNPFSFLYLVHIVMASILLRPAWAWAAMAFTILCYSTAVFLADYNVIPDMMLTPGGIHHGQGYFSCELGVNPPFDINCGLHIDSFLAAFIVTAFFIIFFVGKFQQALKEYQQTLSNLREERIKNEKLASLATFAGGAAHEFSTPLSTIAVASREMLHSLRENNGDQELIDDATLVREQVRRCKEILYQMTADAGEHLGESIEKFRIQDLLAETLLLFSAADNKRITFVNKAGGLTVEMPYRTLQRTVKGLVKNSIDASTEESPITVTCSTVENFLYLEVKDQGTGMDRDTLAKATEPFFTTKAPGKGMGLGLFLTKSVAERFGGAFELQSEPGQGTTAVFALPLPSALHPRNTMEPGHEDHSAG